MHEDLLLHPDVEEGADLSSDQQQPDEDGEEFDELILLLAAFLLLDMQQEIPHTVLQHLIEDSLIVQLHFHRFHPLQGRHLHAHTHHHFAQVVAAVLRLL